MSTPETTQIIAEVNPTLVESLAGVAETLRPPVFAVELGRREDKIPTLDVMTRSVLSLFCTWDKVEKSGVAEFTDPFANGTRVSLDEINSRMNEDKAKLPDVPSVPIDLMVDSRLAKTSRRIANERCISMDELVSDSIVFYLVYKDLMSEHGASR